MIHTFIRTSCLFSILFYFIFLLFCFLFSLFSFLFSLFSFLFSFFFYFFPFSFSFIYFFFSDLNFLKYFTLTLYFYLTFLFNFLYILVIVFFCTRGSRSAEQENEIFCLSITLLHYRGKIRDKKWRTKRGSEGGSSGILRSRVSVADFGCSYLTRIPGDFI